jgi:hypothetical protein
MTRTALFAIVFLALLSSSAWAQFAGDVYFAEPSVAAGEGEPTTLEIQTFSGASALGGAHFVLRFDPAQLAIEAVRPGASPQFQDGLVSRPVPGGIGVVTLNGASVAHPFGTISLVEIVVRPLAPPGTDVEISIDALSLVDGESVPLADVRGLSATIAVTPGPAMQLRAAALGGSPDPGAVDEVVASSPMRRPGYHVLLVRGMWRGGIYIAELVRVAVVDPLSRSD